METKFDQLEENFKKGIIKQEDFRKQMEGYAQELSKNYNYNVNY